MQKTMERYFLIQETDTTITIVSQCFANSYDHAHFKFSNEGEVIGEIISEHDWNEQLKNECELNSLENQSNEC
jgi:hypothetical protein